MTTYRIGFIFNSDRATAPDVHETRKRWDVRGGRCVMKRVGSGIASLYQAFVHVKGSLIPRGPSYDSLWIITQRTRRIYVRARTKDVARCPAYMAHLCFHTYFSNPHEASYLVIQLGLFRRKRSGWGTVLLYHLSAPLFFPTLIGVCIEVSQVLWIAVDF